MNIEQHQREVNGEVLTITKFTINMYDKTFRDGSRFWGKVQWLHPDRPEIVERSFESPTFMGVYDQMIEYLKTTAV